MDFCQVMDISIAIGVTVAELKVAFQLPTISLLCLAPHST